MERGYWSIMEQEEAGQMAEIWLEDVDGRVRLVQEEAGIRGYRRRGVRKSDQYVP